MFSLSRLPSFLLFAHVTTSYVHAFGIVALPRPSAAFGAVSRPSTPSGTSSRPRPRLSRTSLSSDAVSAEDLPFFASFVDGDSSERGTSTVTTRLPLGTIFDGRDYTFSSACNVRSYEWTTRQVDELLDDLTDACAGGPLASGADGAAASMRDYELGQAVAVPAAWDVDALGIGGRYDLYDGQQRVATLCLLFAALRDAFRTEEGGGHSDTARELEEMLAPTKVRKEEVVRIELGRRDDGVMRRILRGEEGAEEGSAGKSVATQRLLENYERLLKRLSAMSTEERVRLLDYLSERVFMLVCVPETASMARNIVMSQGKGMDNEPIDDFKGLVCFRYILDEDDMYDTFDAWDDLASPPDPATGAVGRETVASACLLRASAALRSKIRKNDQIYALERWLRQEIAARPAWRGDAFFERRLRPAASLLGTWRDRGDHRALGCVGRGKGGLAARNVVAGLSFLRDLATGGLPAAAGEGLETVVLDLLLKAERAGEDGRPPLALKRLEESVHDLEMLASWMGATKPTAAQRQTKIHAFLDMLEDEGSQTTSPSLSAQEWAETREMIWDGDLGATPAGRRFAAAIFGRMNAYVVARDSRPSTIPLAPPVVPSATSFRLEHILPVSRATKRDWGAEWPDPEERQTWAYRMANLVLVPGRPTAKEVRGAFDKKVLRYGAVSAEELPLTRCLADLEVWSGEKAVERQQALIEIFDDMWTVQ